MSPYIKRPYYKSIMFLIEEDFIEIYIIYFILGALKSKVSLSE